MNATGHFLTYSARQLSVGKLAAGGALAAFVVMGTMQCLYLRGLTREVRESNTRISLLIATTESLRADWRVSMEHWHEVRQRERDSLAVDSGMLIDGYMQRQRIQYLSPERQNERPPQIYDVVPLAPRGDGQLLPMPP